MQVVITLMVLGVLLLGGYQLAEGPGPNLPTPPPCSEGCHDTGCGGRCVCTQFGGQIMACGNCVTCN